MKKIIIAALLALLPVSALAQVVTELPIIVTAHAVTDLGNGPTELLILGGNGALFTMQGAGVGSTSGSSTTLTLTATAAADPPCVGCIISGAGITSGTTVAAFNGTTGITLSAAMTVAASTPLAWGQACPASPVAASIPEIFVQSNVTPAMPMYTQARICADGHNGPGMQLLPFAIGAH